MLIANVSGNRDDSYIKFNVNGPGFQQEENDRGVD